MEIVRQVVVFDAADLAAESAFRRECWAAASLSIQGGTACSTQTVDG